MGARAGMRAPHARAQAGARAQASVRASQGAAGQTRARAQTSARVQTSSFDIAPTPAIQRFTIPNREPHRLPTFNEYEKACRGGWQAGSAKKKQAKELVARYIRAANLRPMSAPVSISFYWVEANARRDKDNVASAKKYIIDALVSEGIIGNDGWHWIAGSLTDTFRVNPSNPRVEVTIQEVKEEDKYE